MRIAILGARGFLGKRLCQQLTTQGHEVVGYVLNSNLEQNPSFETRSVIDLITLPLSDQSPYDITINLAARRSTRDQRFSENEVNNFTFEIPKEFILHTASSQTIVINASTYIQNYGGENGRTVDSYGAAKEQLSKFLSEKSEIEGFKTRDLFFFTLYGIGDRSNHLVPLLLDAAKSGDQISLSPGYQLMNLLYLDDAVQNILNCISLTDQSFYRKSYVWREDYFSVRELVARIESVIGTEINCDWGSRDYAGHEMMNQWPIPMQQLKGFIATTELEDGIRKIWEASKGDTRVESEI